MVKTVEEKGFFDSVREKVVEGVVKGAEDYVVERVKKRVVRFGEVSVLAVTAFLLIVFGVTLLLGKFFPILDGGYNFLIMGGIFLICAIGMELRGRV